MMELMIAEVPVLDWAAYCALPVTEQLVWKERDDDLNKSMLFLLNSKKDNAKNDLHLAYS